MPTKIFSDQVEKASTGELKKKKNIEAAHALPTPSFELWLELIHERARATNIKRTRDDVIHVTGEREGDMYPAQ